MEARNPISSDRSISSHKANDKEYLVSVKNYPMLYLMVRPNSTKSWVYRYLSPTHSKNKRISLGVYPNVSFARACEIWREYEELLSRNIDPKNHREELKNTLIYGSRYCNTYGYAWIMERISQRFILPLCYCHLCKWLCDAVATPSSST